MGTIWFTDSVSVSILSMPLFPRCSLVLTTLLVSFSFSFIVLDGDADEGAVGIDAALGEDMVVDACAGVAVDADAMPTWSFKIFLVTSSLRPLTVAPAFPPSPPPPAPPPPPHPTLFGL